MILESTDQLKKYVSIASSFAFETFEPYINKAAQTFTKRYIGDLHLTINDLIDEEASGDESGDENDIYIEARELLRAAIANLGMFLYMPYATVLMDASGVSVVANENRQPVKWFQLKDMRRDLLRSGNESLDALLAFLDENADLFEDYKENYCAANNSLIVPNAQTFNNYYNINNSRQTYLALKPTLEIVEDQYIKTMLCSQLVEHLKTDPKKLTQLSENAKTSLAELKIILQKALVSFSVSKVAAIGLFILEANGLRLNYEMYIDGKNAPIDSGKPSQQLQKLETELLANGTNYLQLAKTYIENNAGDFTVCDEPILNSTTTGAGFKAYDTNGILGL